MERVKITNAKSAYEDKTLSKIDQSQLSHNNNALNVASIAENLAPDSFVKSRGTNLTLNEPFVKHDAEPQLLSENSRFSRPVKEVEIEKE